MTVAPGPDGADYPIERLKPIGAVLDPGALLPADILALAAWLGRYYLHEFSSGFLLALPALLRKGGGAELPVEEWVTLTVPGVAILPDQLKRSVAQQQLIALQIGRASCRERV